MNTRLNLSNAIMPCVLTLKKVFPHISRIFDSSSKVIPATATPLIVRLSFNSTLLNIMITPRIADMIKAFII